MRLSTQKFRLGAVFWWLGQETHVREVTGFNFRSGEHFSFTFHLDQSMDQIIFRKLEPGTVACAVILQMGELILRNYLLIKPSSMVGNEIRAVLQKPLSALP